MKKAVLVFSLLLPWNNSYAHGITNTAVIFIFLPALLASLVFIAACALLLMNKPSKKWFLTSLGLFAAQFIWFISMELISKFL